MIKSSSFVLICYFNVIGSFDLNTPINREQEFPQLQINQTTSLGALSRVEIPQSGRIEFDGNVEKIELICVASYPTRWKILPSPIREGSNIKDWWIDKSRFNTSTGETKYWSSLTFEFRVTPNRVIKQNAACHHFQNLDLNPNFNVSFEKFADSEIFTGQFFEGDFLKRTKNSGERYGQNRNCSLVLNVDRISGTSCKNKLGLDTLRPFFMKCANPDECDASIRRQGPDCSLDPVATNCGEYNCSKFLFPSAGALICQYVGGGRENSLARIVYFTLSGHPYFDLVNSPEPLSERLRIEFVDKTRKEDHIHEGTEHEFRCRAVLWSFSQGLHWVLVPNQGSPISLGEGTKRTIGRREYTSTIRITFPSAIGLSRIICYAPVLDSYKLESVSLDLEIKRSVPPVINMLTETPTKLGINIQCDFSGKPLPKIIWKRNGIRLLEAGKTIITERGFGRATLELAHRNANSDATEEFTCEASNLAGNASESIQINTQGPTGNLLALKIGIPLTLCVLVALIIFLGWKIHNKNKRIQQLTNDEIREFNEGNPQCSNNSALFYPYNTDFEISKSKIHFESKILGDGQFGRVMRGRIGNTTVAIKTIKKYADVSYIKALLSELKISGFVGKHDNIVNLIGGCTQNIHTREVYVIYEYCCNGNLLKYLRQSRKEFVDHVKEGRYKPGRGSVIEYQNISVKKVSSKDLLRWCSDITSGMEFLGRKHIIHGDLAARNVLLTVTLSAKIGDFGLSKQIFDYSIYVQRMDCPLPLKWLAIESLRDLEFSIQSDIWSFGITLWEIYSLGLVPYPGIPQWDVECWKKLFDGYRMEKPQYATDEVYKVMLRCWDADPNMRPSFTALKAFFDGVLVLANGI